MEGLALDSYSERDSDHFSKDIFDGFSESVVSVRSRSGAGLTDRVQDSPDPVRTTARRPQPSRCLFSSSDEEETHHQGLGPLKNVTNLPRQRQSPTETDTQKLILEEVYTHVW